MSDVTVFHFHEQVVACHTNNFAPLDCHGLRGLSGRRAGFSFYFTCAPALAANPMLIKATAIASQLVVLVFLFTSFLLSSYGFWRLDPGPWFVLDN